MESERLCPRSGKASRTRLFTAGYWHSFLRVVADVGLCAKRAAVPRRKKKWQRAVDRQQRATVWGWQLRPAVQLARWQARPPAEHVCVRTRACVCFYTLWLKGQKLSCRSHTAPPLPLPLFIPLFFLPPPSCTTTGLCCVCFWASPPSLFSQAALILLTTSFLVFS